MEELVTGRELSDTTYRLLMDDLISSIILKFMAKGLEDFEECVARATDDLEHTTLLPADEQLTFEEAEQLAEKAEVPAREFAMALALDYGLLSKKYIGTRSWETYRKKQGA